MKSIFKPTMWIAAVIAAFTMFASPASAHDSKHDRNHSHKSKPVVMKECYKGKCHTVKYVQKRHQYRPPHVTYYYPQPRVAYAKPYPVYYRYPAYYNAPRSHGVIYWR